MTIRQLNHRIHQLEAQAEAVRLDCGLDLEHADYEELDSILDRLSQAIDQKASIERSARLERARHVRGLIKYRAERFAFTI